jgi:hypothetical protein
MEVLQTSALPLGYGAGRTGKLFPCLDLLKSTSVGAICGLADSAIWATIKAIAVSDGWATTQVEKEV